MTEHRLPTFAATIFIAGEIADARRCCRKFCMEGLCVTIEPIDFVYTGGAEAGVRVGLVNYPRFPSEPAKIVETAIRLANALRDDLCQHSWLIVTPTETVWNSAREAGCAP